MRSEGRQPFEELLDQTCLPDARGRDQAHEKRPPFGEGPAGDKLQLLEVRVTSHERDPLRNGTTPPPLNGHGQERLAFPLSLDLHRRPEFKRMRRRPRRPLAAPHGPRLGRLLQARGDVDRVTGDQKVPR